VEAKKNAVKIGVLRGGKKGVGDYKIIKRKARS